MVTMAELDRLLELTRGTASYYRRRGLFKAQVGSKGQWLVREEDLPEVSDLLVQQVMVPDGFVSVSQASRALRLAKSTIYNQINRGRIKAFRHQATGRLFIKEKDIEKYRMTRLPSAVAMKLARRGITGE